MEAKAALVRAYCGVELGNYIDNNNATQEGRRNTKPIGQGYTD